MTKDLKTTIGGVQCSYYTERKRMQKLMLDRARELKLIRDIDEHWAIAVLKNLDANPEIEFEIIGYEDLGTSGNHCLLLSIAYTRGYKIENVKRFSCFRIYNKNQKPPQIIDATKHNLIESDIIDVPLIEG